MRIKNWFEFTALAFNAAMQAERDGLTDVAKTLYDMASLEELRYISVYSPRVCERPI
jgi:hypothetical protein